MCRRIASGINLVGPSQLGGTPGITTAEVEVRASGSSSPRSSGYCTGSDGSVEFMQPAQSLRHVETTAGAAAHKLQSYIHRDGMESLEMHLLPGCCAISFKAYPIKSFPYARLGPFYDLHAPHDQPRISPPHQPQRHSKGRFFILDDSVGQRRKRSYEVIVLEPSRLPLLLHLLIQPHISPIRHFAKSS